MLSKPLRAWGNVEDMIEFYGDLHRFEPQLIEPRLPVVMNRKIGDELSLDLREPGIEPTIRATSGGEDLGFFSTSWEVMLFQSAIDRCERRRFEHRRFYGSSKASVNKALTLTGHFELSALICEVLGDQGFDLPWVNDARHVYGLGGDMSVLVDIGMEGSTSLVVLGGDTKRMRAVGDLLATAVGAAPNAESTRGSLDEVPR